LKFAIALRTCSQSRWATISERLVLHRIDTAREAELAPISNVALTPEADIEASELYQAMI